MNDLTSLFQKRTTRRRYQSPKVQDDGDRWTARWREDMLQPDGTVKRVRRWDVIAMKAEVPSKRKAQAILDERMRAINSDTYKPVSSVTFSTFAGKWMASVMVHHKESTQLEEKRQIERDLKPIFGQVPLRDISAEVIQTWVSDLKLSPKTVANRVGTLRTMWATAKTWGYVQHDPFDGLKLPTRQAAKVYQFSAEEMLAIIHAATGWYGLLFELLAKTGMRPGEAGGLRPEDLDGRVIHVRQAVWKGKVQTTKTTGSVRDFLISDSLADRLRRHIEENPNPHGLIFVNQAGKPMNMDKFNQKVLRPILEKLGLWEKIRAAGVRCGNYAFRHGNVTEMSRSGVPLKTIQSRVGHTAGSEVTMTHYVHAVSEDDRRAADLMEELLSPRRDGESVQ